MSLRGAREFKKEVKEPFFFDALGEESVHAFTGHRNSSTRRPHVHTGVHKTCTLTHKCDTDLLILRVTNTTEYLVELESVVSSQGVLFHRSSNN